MDSEIVLLVFWIIVAAGMVAIFGGSGGDPFAGYRGGSENDTRSPEEYEEGLKEYMEREEKGLNL